MIINESVRNIFLFFFFGGFICGKRIRIENEMNNQKNNTIQNENNEITTKVLRINYFLNCTCRKYDCRLALAASSTYSHLIFCF